MRTKYKIDKNTPIVISDNDDGTFTLKVMKIVDPNDIVYRETKDSIGLTFKNRIDPELLIKAIKDSDGQNS